MLAGRCARRKGLTMTEVINTLNWDAVSSVVSILGFIAVLLTLAEMKSQRTHSYKPLLALKKPYIVIQNNPQGVPFKWKNKSDEISNDGELWVDIELTNIGFGTANEIEILWKIDADKMSMQIDSENEIAMFKKTVMPEGFFYTYKGFGFSIDRESTDTKQELGHLVSGSCMNIRLPMSVKDYLSFLCLAKAKNEQPNVNETGIVPLLIETKCLDISGKEIRQTIQLKYDLIVKKYIVDKPNGNFVFGRLYFINSRKPNKLITTK